MMFLCTLLITRRVILPGNLYISQLLKINGDTSFYFSSSVHIAKSTTVKAGGINLLYGGING